MTEEIADAPRSQVIPDEIPGRRSDRQFGTEFRIEDLARQLLPDVEPADHRGGCLGCAGCPAG